MSMRDYPLYYQGSLLTPEVFDAVPLLRYLLEKDEIDLSSEAAESLEAGQLTPALQAELCDAFYMDDVPYASLDDFKDEMLTYNSDAYETLESLLNQQKGVSYHYLRDIEADFYYSDGHPSDSVENAALLAFSIPLVWKPRGEAQPSSLEEAIAWLNNAGVPVFQDDIDWEPRLGELLGTIYG